MVLVEEPPTWERQTDRKSLDTDSALEESYLCLSKNSQELWISMFLTSICTNCMGVSCKSIASPGALLDIKHHQTIHWVRLYTRQGIPSSKCSAPCSCLSLQQQKDWSFCPSPRVEGFTAFKDGSPSSLKTCQVLLFDTWNMHWQLAQANRITQPRTCHICTLYYL